MNVNEEIEYWKQNYTKNKYSDFVRIFKLLFPLTHRGSYDPALLYDLPEPIKFDFFDDWFLLDLKIDWKAWKEYHLCKLCKQEGNYNLIQGGLCLRIDGIWDCVCSKHKGLNSLVEISLHK